MPFAARAQGCCRALDGLDHRVSGLRRGKSAVAFADLPAEKATALVLKNNYRATVCTPTLSKGYVSLSMSRGSPPHSPGVVQMSADDDFWRDEDLIRRVTAALIDFWDAEQATVSTLDLLPMAENGRFSWCFWLDWRRTRDTPTLMPDVRMFGQPSIEREWLGGVERLWPEHEPWRHLPAPQPA